MSENTIEQVREPGRENPYITIVDTGVALAAASFVGMLELWMDEALSEGMSLADFKEGLVWGHIDAISAGLLKELKERTF